MVYKSQMKSPMEEPWTCFEMNELISKRKGWINDNDVYLDLCPDTLRLAFGSRSLLGFITTDYQAKCVEEQDEADEIVHICWIDHEYIAASYASGFVRLWNTKLELVVAQKFHTSSVKRLERVLGLNAMGNSSMGKTTELWILYQDATLVTVSVAEFVGLVQQTSQASSAISFRKWSLTGQNRVDQVLCCGTARPTLFQSHARVGACSIISSGFDPPISFYIAGAEHKSIHFGQIATAVASKVATAAYSAVSMFAKSWGLASTEVSTGTAEGEDEEKDNEDLIAETIPDRLAMYRTLNDPRRIVQTMCLDPTGRLAATTGNFGRVLLIDTRHQVVVRIWKGYRNAQCHWIESPEKWTGQSTGQPLDPSNLSTATYGLYLVIYSPVRGLVEVWRARFGPLVLSIPVGSMARLFTVPGKQSRCFVLKENGNQVERQEIVLTEQSRSIVYSYFNANSNQEESFLLYKALDAIQSACRQSDLSPDWTQTTQVYENIGELTQLDSIRRFVDELDEIKAVGLLGPLFHLECTTLLLKSLVDTAGEKRSEGMLSVSSALLWKLCWRKRLLQAYNDIQEEIADESIEIQERSELNPKLDAWINALMAQSNNSRPAPEQRLDCLSFLQFFTFPIEVPATKDDDFSKLEAIERVLEQKNVRSLKNIGAFAPPQRRVFVAFLFQPLLGDVFAVKRIRQIQKSILISNEEQVELFLEWLSQLSVQVLISLPTIMTSSPLQRWIREYFTEMELDEPNETQMDTKVRLPVIPHTVKRLYDFCRNTPSLVHAFYLSEHCAVAEEEIAREMEAKSMGKYTMAGAGYRWRILQTCLQHTCYLTLGLKSALSIEAVESGDEVLRAIGKAQVTTNKPSGDQDPIPKSDLEHRTKGNVSVYSVLVHYPQLHQPDRLCCFRLIHMCEEWQKDRLKMHLLERMRQELTQIQDSERTIGMAFTIWQNYLREHALQLLQFWEHPPGARTINAAAALELFETIRQVLTVLEGALRLSCKVSEMVADQDESDDDDEVDEEDILSTNLLCSDEIIYSMAETSKAYKKLWPLSQSESVMEQTILGWKLDPPSRVRVEDHIRLIRLLITYVATNAAPIRPSLLFVDGGQYLCQPNGLSAHHEHEARRKLSPEDKEKVELTRLEYLRTLIRFDDRVALDLASVFSFPLDLVRKEHALYLYQIGKDVLAEDIVMKIQNTKQMAVPLAAIARSRLAIILTRMRSSAEYAPLMTAIAADTCAWILSDAVPFPATFQVQHTPSLSATHNLVLRSLQFMDKASTEYSYAIKMSDVSKGLIEIINLRSGL